VRDAVAPAEPDAIVYQATALADVRFGRNFDRTFAQTNRLRTGGTDNLLAAARETGVHLFVAQSFASMRNARRVRTPCVSAFSKSGRTRDADAGFGVFGFGHGLSLSRREVSSHF